MFSNSIKQTIFLLKSFSNRGKKDYSKLIAVRVLTKRGYYQTVYKRVDAIIEKAKNFLKEDLEQQVRSMGNNYNELYFNFVREVNDMLTNKIDDYMKPLEDFVLDSVLHYLSPQKLHKIKEEFLKEFKRENFYDTKIIYDITDIDSIMLEEKMKWKNFVRRKKDYFLRKILKSKKEEFEMLGNNYVFFRRQAEEVRLFVIKKIFNKILELKPDLKVDMKNFYREMDFEKRDEQVFLSYFSDFVKKFNNLMEREEMFFVIGKEEENLPFFKEQKNEVKNRHILFWEKDENYSNRFLEISSNLFKKFVKYKLKENPNNFFIDLSNEFTRTLYKVLSWQIDIDKISIINFKEFKKNVVENFYLLCLYKLAEKKGKRIVEKNE